MVNTGGLVLPYFPEHRQFHGYTDRQLTFSHRLWWILQDQAGVTQRGRIFL